MKSPPDPVGAARLGVGLLVVLIVSSIALSAVAGASTAPQAPDSGVAFDRPAPVDAPTQSRDQTEAKETQTNASTDSDESVRVSSHGGEDKDTAVLWRGFKHAWQYNHRLNRFGSWVENDLGPLEDGDYHVHHSGASGAGADNASVRDAYTELSARNVGFEGGSDRFVIKGNEKRPNGNWLISNSSKVTVPLQDELKNRDTYTVLLNGFDTYSTEKALKPIRFELWVTSPTVNREKGELTFHIEYRVLMDCDSAECGEKKGDLGIFGENGNQTLRYKTEVHYLVVGGNDSQLNVVSGRDSTSLQQSYGWKGCEGKVDCEHPDGNELDADDYWQYKTIDGARGYSVGTVGIKGLHLELDSEAHFSQYDTIVGGSYDAESGNYDLRGLTFFKEWASRPAHPTAIGQKGDVVVGADVALLQIKDGCKRSFVNAGGIKWQTSIGSQTSASDPAAVIGKTRHYEFEFGQHWPGYADRGSLCTYDEQAHPEATRKPAYWMQKGVSGSDAFPPRTADSEVGVEDPTGLRYALSDRFHSKYPYGKGSDLSGLTVKFRTKDGDTAPVGLSEDGSETVDGGFYVDRAEVTAVPNKAGHTVRRRFLRDLDTGETDEFATGDTITGRGTYAIEVISNDSGKEPARAVVRFQIIGSTDGVNESIGYELRGGKKTVEYAWDGSDDRWEDTSGTKRPSSLTFTQSLTPVVSPESVSGSDFRVAMTVDGQPIESGQTFGEKGTHTLRIYICYNPATASCDASVTASSPGVVRVAKQDFEIVHPDPRKDAYEANDHLGDSASLPALNENQEQLVCPEMPEFLLGDKTPGADCSTILTNPGSDAPAMAVRTWDRTVENLSLHESSDTDFYAFSLPATDSNVSDIPCGTSKVEIDGEKMNVTKTNTLEVIVTPTPNSLGSVPVLTNLQTTHRYAGKTPIKLYHNGTQVDATKVVTDGGELNAMFACPANESDASSPSLNLSFGEGMPNAGTYELRIKYRTEVRRPDDISGRYAVAAVTAERVKEAMVLNLLLDRLDCGGSGFECAIKSQVPDHCKVAICRDVSWVFRPEPGLFRMTVRADPGTTFELFTPGGTLVASATTIGPTGTLSVGTADGSARTTTNTPTTEAEEDERVRKRLSVQNLSRGVYVLVVNGSSRNYTIQEFTAGSFDPPAPPTATFTSTPEDPAVNELVRFDASESTGPENESLRYEWDLDGDGTTDATGRNVSYAYPSAARVEVTLTVITESGGMNATTETVTVRENEPPAASITLSGIEDGTVADGEQITIDASGSTDPDGELRLFEFDLDDDSAFERTTTNRTISYTFFDPGVRVIRVRVTDDDGATATAKTELTVEGEQAPPTAALNVTPEAPSAGEPVTLNASLSKDTDGAVLLTMFDTPGAETPNATDHVDGIINRTYPVADVYKVELTVVDDDGLKNTTTETFTVREPDDDTPPSIEFPTATDSVDFDGTVTGGDKIVVSATVTDSGTGVDTVIANASAFGVKTVSLTQEDSTDTYVGTFTVNASASAGNGSYPIRIAATDTAGNTAEADTNTLALSTCIAGAVSGSDDTIGLAEIQDAINWWAEGTEVPDTGGKTISLSEIQDLINAWAEDTPVSCS